MPTFRSDSSAYTTMTVTLTETARSNYDVTMAVNWSVTTGSATSLGSSSDRTLYIKKSSDNSTLGSAVIKDGVYWGSSSTYSGSFSITFNVGTYNSGSLSVYIQTSNEGTQSCIWMNRAYCIDFGVSWSTFYTSITAPTSVTASPVIAESSIGLSWSGASDGINNPISAYHVYYQYSDDGGSNWSSLAYLANASTTTSYVHGITVQPRYRTFKYKILANKTNYGSNVYSDYSNTARRNSLPVAPTSPTVSAIYVAPGDTIRVSFTASTDVDVNLAGYQVAMKDASGNWYGSPTIVGTNASSGATYVDVDTTGWTPATQWYFYVRAYDSLSAFGNWSSATALVTIGNAPSVPQTVLYNGSTGAYGESPVRISWSAPTTTYGLSYAYEVRLGVWNGTDYTYGEVISTGSTAYYDWNISGYTRGLRLYAQIRATNSIGSSAWAGNSIALYYNRLPNTPTVVFPKSSSTTYNPNPRIGFLYGTDDDGQSVLGIVTLNGTTKDATDSYWSKTGRQTTAVQSLVQGWMLEPDSYTVVAKSNDGLANSSQTQRTFTVAATNWTDNSISAGATLIKAAHITELRSAIEAVYGYYGLTAPTWTDSAITAGVTPIKAVHITEMRAAIDAVRTYVNGFDSGTSKDIAAFSWTDSSLSRKRIKAIHITELRNAVATL